MGEVEGPGLVRLDLKAWTFHTGILNPKPLNPETSNPKPPSPLGPPKTKKP